MEPVLVFAWFGGFVPWCVAIALFFGFRDERRASNQLNCACCGYSTSAAICPECGASEADRVTRLASKQTEKGIVAISASVLSMLVALFVLVWVSPSVTLFGLVCISPIPVVVGSIILLQRSVVSVRLSILTAGCLLTLFGVLYFVLLRSVQGGTDPLGPGLVYMFASVIIAPMLGYALVPSIIVLLLRKGSSVR
ncbi:MAG: hypothetical protein ACK58T_50665 [Phycisphaerae bacterium]